MTEAEALALAPGTLVEVKLRAGPEKGRWVLMRIERVYKIDSHRRGRRGVRVWVGDGLGTSQTTSGRKRHALPNLPASRVRLPAALPPLDPLPANVYADWLEEHGEHRAAALLREAFPLGPPED
jgi:hypothetical protein